MSRASAIAFHIWPVAIFAAVTAWVLVTELNGRPDLHTKPVQEHAGIALSLLAFAVALVRLLTARNKFAIVLAALTGTLAMRELHFEWTEYGSAVATATYILLGGIVALTVLWRHPLTAFAARAPRVRTWIIIAAAGYILSQAVARRAVQHIAGEDSSVSAFLEERHGDREQFPVYGDLEELLENAAHLTLLCAVIAPPWREETKPADI